MNNYLSNQSCMFAFNIWDFNSARYIMDAANSRQKSVILQTSEGIFRNADAPALRDFVSEYAKKKEMNVWLHLDHCRDMDTILNAIKCGWDSVMLDASNRPLSENIALTKVVMEEAHKKGVLVETEIGQIKGIEDDTQFEESTVADKDEIQEFLHQVKPDMLAVAFGNAHGMYKGTPKLHFELIDYVAELTDIPFVVHGGSGLTEAILRILIKKSNVKKINISTEVKMAYRAGILLSMEQGLLRENGFQAAHVEENIKNAIYTMALGKLGLLERDILT